MIIVDNPSDRISLVHPFKDIVPDVDEFFQAETEIGCINTMNALCNRIKQLSAKYSLQIDENKFKGDALEIFAEYFCKTNASDNRVGIYDYCPVDVDDDTGVDGHGIGENGYPATVQVKFRPGDYVLTANEDHLSNFLTSSWGDFSVRIEDEKNMLIITTGLKVDERSRERMLKNKVRVLNREALREMLDNRPEWWIRFYESVKASRLTTKTIEPIPLRIHQTEAVEAVMKDTDGIGKVIMPTGCGKSWVEAEIIKRTICEHKSNEIPIIKINASRILLCFQLFEEVYKYLNQYGIVARYVNYNSGNVSDKNMITELRKQGGVYREIVSTTSTNELKNAYKKAQKESLPFIVFSTYHSSEKFALSGLVPHLTLHDEAHNLVSNEFHRSILCPTKKNFFFTATEKVTESDRDLGMNNEELFGNMIYSKSPREMIDRGEMVPPHIHVVRSKRGLKVDLDKLEHDYEALITSIIDAFKEHQNKIRSDSYRPEDIGAKVLVVCRGQQDLHEMFKTKVFENFHEQYPEINLYALSSDFGLYNNGDYYKAPVTHVKKFKFLKDIKNLKSSDKCIIFHVDMIGEGIDVPSITGVMPFRNCELSKFIQNVGRSSRLHVEDRKRVYSGEIMPSEADRCNGRWIKPYSWVIIPEFLENSDGFVNRFKEILREMINVYGYIPRQETFIDNVRGLDDDELIDTVNDKNKKKLHSKSGLTEFEHDFEQPHLIMDIVEDMMHGENVNTLYEDLMTKCLNSLKK